MNQPFGWGHHTLLDWISCFPERSLSCRQVQISSNHSHLILNNQQTFSCLFQAVTGLVLRIVCRVILPFPTISCCIFSFNSAYPLRKSSFECLFEGFYPVTFELFHWFKENFLLSFYCFLMNFSLLKASLHFHLPFLPCWFNLLFWQPFDFFSYFLTLTSVFVHLS